MKPKSKFRARSGDYRVLLRWRQEIRNYSFEYLARLVSWLQEKRKAEARKMKLIVTNGGIHVIGNDDDFMHIQNIREFVVDKTHDNCVCIVMERRGESEGHPFVVQVFEFMHEKEATMAEALFFELKRKIGGLSERASEAQLVPRHEDSSDSEAQKRTRDQSLQVSLGPDENEGWSEEERLADRRRIEHLTRMLDDLKRKVTRREMRDQACSPIASSGHSPRTLSLAQWRQSSQDGMRDVLLLPAKETTGDDEEVERILDRNKEYSSNSGVFPVVPNSAGQSTSIYGQTASGMTQPGIYSGGMIQQQNVLQPFASNGVQMHPAGGVPSHVNVPGAGFPAPMGGTHPLLLRLVMMQQNGGAVQPRRPLMPFGGLNRFVMTMEDLEAPSPCPVPEVVHQYEPENTRSILKRDRDCRADKKVTFVQ